MQHLDDMERVRTLGGLHVIGSERHEARRIDNQLRGRAARQGDPGSSRFYLSLEDELMRLFGGAQADGLMQRLKIDDAMPLEVGLVSRLVEQSQTRVEGSNFDIRKHLLEYDDVLNTQRAKIYAQRNRIFSKDDLSDDVDEMLRTEVNRRVPEALDDEGGPWKLMSWLDQIQPTFTAGGKIFPSFPLQLLAENILRGQTTLEREEVLQSLRETGLASLDAEREHLLQQVNTLLDQTQEKLESQLKERMESVDTYFDGLEVDEDEQPRRPAEMVADISNLVHLPIKLSLEGQRALRENPKSAAEEIRGQVETTLVNQAVNRLVGAVEHRLEEPLALTTAQLSTGDWNTIAEQILAAVETVFDNRSKRYLGEAVMLDGQIMRDLQTALERMPSSIDENLLVYLLVQMPQGAKATFDKKTHRRMWQRTNRMTFIYHAAHFLEGRAQDEVAADVLAHLERAQAAMYQAWGQAEWNRNNTVRIENLNEKTQQHLATVFGDERFQEIKTQALNDLDNGEREQAIELLGREALTEIYRQLLLNVTSELWIDYLTSMEALRISIGLEAYAQRDPLVQYKNRAFGLFQELLNNMRLGVVSRMFTYRPREISASQSSAAVADEAEETETNGQFPADVEF